MSRLLRVLSVCMLLFVAVGLVACGGANERDVKNAYVQRVNEAQTDFADTVTTVSKRITSRSTSSQDRKTLQRFQVAIQDVVRKLEAIKAPDDLRIEHAGLVRAMTTFGTQIKKATAALRNPDSAAIAGAQRTIQTATQTVNARINSAIAAINSKINAK